MFGILKKIYGFSSQRQKLLKKSIAVALLGAVFSAVQFGALMLTLDILLAGADCGICLLYTSFSYSAKRTQLEEPNWKNPTERIWLE